MAILEVEHIKKKFGKTDVLKDISFSLEQGEDHQEVERQHFFAV